MQQFFSLITLALVACAPRTVPKDALSQVPSQQVGALGDIQDQLRQAETRLAETRDERDRAKTRLDDKREELEDLTKQLADARKRSLSAIEAGDAALAQGAETSVDALEARVADRRPEYQADSDRYNELDLEVEMLEAETKWLAAHLEAERARAAVAGGADLEISRMERRERRCDDKYQQARQEWLSSLDPSEREAVDSS